MLINGTTKESVNLMAGAQAATQKTDSGECSQNQASGAVDHFSLKGDLDQQIFSPQKARVGDWQRKLETMLGVYATGFTEGSLAVDIRRDIGRGLYVGRTNLLPFSMHYSVEVNGRLPDGTVVKKTFTSLAVLWDPFRSENAQAEGDQAKRDVIYKLGNYLRQVTRNAVAD